MDEIQVPHMYPSDEISEADQAKIRRHECLQNALGLIARGFLRPYEATDYAHYLESYWADGKLFSTGTPLPPRPGVKPKTKH